MATTKTSGEMSFFGTVQMTPTAVTILIDGIEVYSGQVGIGQPLNTEIELTTVTPIALGSRSVSMSVTSGVLGVGQVKIRSNGIDCRTSILINGQLPELPPPTITWQPGNDPNNPDWTGWVFEVSAGETITFNVDVQ